MSAFTNYYGVDWGAMIVTLWSIHLLGERRKVGFIVGIFANVLWMAFGVLAGSWASPVANGIALFINFKGYLRWASSELPPVETTSV